MQKEPLSERLFSGEEEYIIALAYYMMFAIFWQFLNISVHKVMHTKK